MDPRNGLGSPAVSHRVCAECICHTEPRFTVRTAGFVPDATHRIHSEWMEDFDGDPEP